MFNHDNGYSAILEQLQKISFSSTKKQRLGLIIGLSIFVLGIVFAFWGFLQPNIVNPQFIVGVIICLIAAGIIIYFEVSTKKIINKNLRKIEKYGFDLHQIYFDAAITEKYKGLTIKNCQDDSFREADLIFNFNGQEIFWNIDEDIEMRQVTTVDSKGRRKTVTYKVYILKSRLENLVPEIDGLDSIDIEEGNASKLFARNRFWQSESVEFNQSYRVSYENELQMVKLFSPKVIDNFNQSQNKFNGRKIHLENGKCSIFWRSGEENLVSNNPKLLDWNGLKWNENHHQKIAEKISLDFLRFEENQILIEPFEFGKLEKNAASC